jgi:hypothetical protein
MWWYRENEFVSEVGRTEGEVEMLLLVSFMKCVAILKLRHSTPLIVLQIELIDVHDSILSIGTRWTPHRRAKLSYITPPELTTSR